MDDWVRLHNSGGDGGSSVLSTALCFVSEFSRFVFVLDDNFD